MRILALRADEGGCYFYRLGEPSRVLNSSNLDVKVDIRGTLDIDGTSNGVDVEIFNVKTDADIVIFQRPLLKALFEAMKWLQARGVKCIVEIDDDFEAVHPKSMAWSAIQPQFSPHSNWKNLALAAREADWVTVSTPALAEKYGKHGRVSVLPNLVPESIFSIQPNKSNRPAELIDSVTVGWTGTTQTHPNDIQVTSGILNQFKNDFVVVGDKKRVKELAGIEREIYETGWVPLERYYQTISDHIDIGIVPLEISQFNNCKSNLKSLEFTALGIPNVVSPTSENKSLGTGLIAKRPRDWYRHIDYLTSSQDHRDKTRQHGLDVVQSMTYENYSDRWYNVWRHVLDS
jgi:hypothetical protein